MESKIELGLGPQLFLDDAAIAQVEGLTRIVHPPRRLPQPVLDNARFGTWQPYLSVYPDPDTGRFRIWYNRGPAIWHAESEDGIEWVAPREAWNPSPPTKGGTVIDDRGRETDPGRRFKLATWQAIRRREDRPKDDNGMCVAFSPDGLTWTPYAGNPVLRSWPSGWPTVERHGIGDIVDAYYDPLRDRYGCAVKLPALPEDGYAPAPRAPGTFRRLVGQSASQDFMHWERPQRIFLPDDRDEGLLEFYGMGGVHARGSLLIGLLRVLRDDLPCDPGGPNDGVGYTVLATSRDGVTWQRDREPFLDRNPEPESWDHAMTWIGGALPVGDELFLYYGGYARGHKVERKRERQIGLARMPRDRYVSLTAGAVEARLRTRSFRMVSERLTLNVRARDGEVRARLLDPAGNPWPEFDWTASAPLTVDTLDAEVRWKAPLRTLRDQPVSLEFRLRQADLFGFEFHRLGK